jgi:hypothetical protein
LKLQYDEQLSKFAFNFSVRRYDVALTELDSALAGVGRCSLPVSKPVLTAPIITALEAPKW